MINDLKSLEDILDFSYLDKSQELFSKKNQKVIGKYKIETPEINWIDEFIALRSEIYSFECGDDNKTKLKGFLNLNQSILNLRKTKLFRWKGISKRM